MSNLMPSQIVNEVRDVLRNAAQGKGNRPQFLTAFQILNRPPEPIRRRLVAERTAGGRGVGVSYGAPSVVSDAAEMLKPEVVVEYLDTEGLSIDSLDPSYAVCGIYRWIGAQ